MRRSEFIELGLRLAMIRKKLKLSQRRFAAACGISHNYLCELEKGQHQPSKKGSGEKYFTFPLSSLLS